MASLRIVFFTFASLQIIIGASSYDHGVDDDLLECLTQQFRHSNLATDVIHTPQNAAYASLLPAFNRRPQSLSPNTPHLILTPFHASEIQAAVHCARQVGIQIRVRSGGHDYEGLSYISGSPFLIVDMRNFRSVTIDDEEKTAWVQVGATLGQLYYTLSRKSKTHSFPAGVCPTVGVGGHFSGGEYGMISRRHSLSVDHIVDAKLVNADGDVLDRKTMGEDLFWAIRDGGAASLGIVLEFKVELVTFFNVTRTLEENATELEHRWQYIADTIDDHEDFLECLHEELQNFSSNVYKQSNSSYSSILRFSSQNLRFMSDSTPKPHVIITPENESQIPHIIYCAKENDMQIRIRSGGHDYEGLSYVSRVPFVILDLINFSEVTVDAVEKTAWVESGATIGSLYYRIAEKSPVLGFPAGVCPTVGVGGHFSGGGYGTLLRKYGLAADNVIDARIIDVNGRILDRKSMGEDLFWAIRGGGGASFGVILAWKVQLVDVPETVTVFTINKTLEQNATQLIYKWQYVAPRFDKDLFIRIIAQRVNTTESGRKTTIRASFNSIFLGGVDRLLPLMQERFLELGLLREDCTEMSWIQSILYFAGFPIESREVLLSRTQPSVRYFKAKSDYVQKPVPEYGLEGIWKLFYEAEADDSEITLSPYGGLMDEIPESSIPFPHRFGNMYKIQHLVYWQENENQNSARYINWIRRLHSYMAPYVSRFPRSAYINYRDLDIGVNNHDEDTSHEQARVWGLKYFKNNFDRLVRVKTAVDPDNFFRNEQSLPPLPSRD